MENLEKSWNFKMVMSRPGKVLEKKKNPKNVKKVVEFFLFIHMLIYTVYILYVLEFSLLV